MKCAPFLLVLSLLCPAMLISDSEPCTLAIEETVDQQPETSGESPKDKKFDRENERIKIELLVKMIIDQDPKDPNYLMVAGALKVAVEKYVQEIAAANPKVADPELSRVLGVMLESDVEGVYMASMWAFGELAERGVPMAPTEAQMRIIETHAKNGFSMKDQGSLGAKEVAEMALEKVRKASPKLPAPEPRLENQSRQMRLSDIPDYIVRMRKLVDELRGHKAGTPEFNACKNKLYAELQARTQILKPGVSDKDLIAELDVMLGSDVEAAHWAALWAFQKVRPSEFQLKRIMDFADHGTASEKQVAAETLHRLRNSPPTSGNADEKTPSEIILTLKNPDVMVTLDRSIAALETLLRSRMASSQDFKNCRAELTLKLDAGAPQAKPMALNAKLSYCMDLIQKKGVATTTGDLGHILCQFDASKAHLILPEQAMAGSFPLPSEYAGIFLPAVERMKGAEGYISKLRQAIIGDAYVWEMCKPAKGADFGGEPCDVLAGIEKQNTFGIYVSKNTGLPRGFSTSGQDNNNVPFKVHLQIDYHEGLPTKLAGTFDVSGKTGNLTMLFGWNGGMLSKFEIHLDAKDEFGVRAALDTRLNIETNIALSPGDLESGFIVGAFQEPDKDTFIKTAGSVAMAKVMPMMPLLQPLLKEKRSKGSAPQKGSRMGDPIVDNMPIWIRTGGYEDGHFYGVGVFAGEGIGNDQLMNKGAQADAKGNLAAALHAQVALCVEEWAASVGHLVKTPLDKVRLMNAAKKVVDEGLVGARMIDAWHNGSTGDYHVLLKLPFDKVEASIKVHISELITTEIPDHASEAQEALVKALAGLKKARSGK